RVRIPAASTESPVGNNQPVSPCSTISEAPPTAEARTGVPTLAASRRTVGNESKAADAKTSKSSDPRKSEGRFIHPNHTTPDDHVRRAYRSWSCSNHVWSSLERSVPAISSSQSADV